MADNDVAEDVIALLRASGPHWQEIDRTSVAEKQGLLVDIDPHLRDVLWQSLDLLAFATVRIAARQGVSYDQIVDEWEAVMAADARRAAAFPPEATADPE